MTEDERAWAQLDHILDTLADTPVPVWLRDDDAVTVTPALERLGALLDGLPLVLATVPAGAGPDLARWVAARPGVVACQHGWAHRNHAGTGERACELGGARSDAVVLEELARGREAMTAVFGPAWCPVLVPPWNRIRPSLLPALPAAGYAALSTFAGAALPATTVTLPRLDCDLDIIDWRNGRRGRSIPDLCGRLAALVGAARLSGAPVGVLTHHLAHDEAAWRFLAGFLARLRAHAGLRAVDPTASVAATRPVTA